MSPELSLLLLLVLDTRQLEILVSLGPNSSSTSSLIRNPSSSLCLGGIVRQAIRYRPVSWNSTPLVQSKPEQLFLPSRLFAARSFLA
jgi:hypothetical protein